MRSTVFKLFALALAAVALAGCHPKTQAGQDAAFGGAAHIDKAFVGRIYYLPDGTQKLPDFRMLPSRGVVYARQLNVPDQDFSLGFPGVTNRFEWFAIDYKGAFTVNKPGHYLFRLSSDDGSRLFIDGKLVIDNDGVHATSSASGETDLAAGRHSIEVPYFQGPATRVSLQFFCTQPGGQEQIFPGCGLNLAQPDLVPSWLMWLLVILVIAAVFLIARRGTPAAGPRAGDAAEEEGRDHD